MLFQRQPVRLLCVMPLRLYIILNEHIRVSIAVCKLCMQFYILFLMKMRFGVHNENCQLLA